MPLLSFQSSDLHTTTHVTICSGSHKHSGRRRLVHNVKDDGSSIISDGKLLKRGGSSGYVPHEVCLQLYFVVNLDHVRFFCLVIC